MLQNLCPGKVSKLLVVLALFIGTSTAFGQSAAFTYQGRLTDGGTAANGIYDMQFKLYDTATVGRGVPMKGSGLIRSLFDSIPVPGHTGERNTRDSRRRQS